jgi:hypothetical protein
MQVLVHLLDATTAIRFTLILLQTAGLRKEAYHIWGKLMLLANITLIGTLRQTAFLLGQITLGFLESSLLESAASGLAAGSAV